MTIVFKASPNIQQKMIEHYSYCMREKKPPYSVFQAVEADTVITLYESGKVMFQGISADIDANLWIDMEKHLNNRVIDINNKDSKTKEKNKGMVFLNTVGSDEVGTGDFYGPIVVTSTYVSKENIGFLSDLGVKDSKVVTDEKIIKIAPQIMKRIPHCTYILTNEMYNKVYSESYNMNRIKAVLHNKVLFDLMAKEEYPYDKIVVDQFVYPKKYYEHIREEKNKVSHITFETKAESRYMSVAASSIISRYIFLQEMDKLSKQYNINIPLGAGDQADIVGKELLKQYGKDIFSKIAKLNFKNIQKITEK